MYSDFKVSYEELKEAGLKGRYITASHLKEPLRKLSDKFEVRILGESVKGTAIKSVTLGSGKIKILAWSQMHGNESTTTKAVFDLLNAFSKNAEADFMKLLLQECTICVIPMLNPDGAEMYTRVNAHAVDLNRDALEQKEPESRILRKAFEDFKPDYCFNLHDQRTIFSAGQQAYPATLSFLTPAQNTERSVTDSRKVSMRLIAAMVKDLQTDLPGRIGRYDDSYNPNCTGDSFQSMGVPTVLFEAGHFPEDYQREVTRKFVACALYSALYSIASGNLQQKDHEEYFTIPGNQKLFYDVILRNARLESGIRDVAIQFREMQVKEEIVFVPVVERIEDRLDFFGHKELDCEQKELGLMGEEKLRENVLVSKIRLNNEILAINYDSF